MEIDIYDSILVTGNDLYCVCAGLVTNENYLKLTNPSVCGNILKYPNYNDPNLTFTLDTTKFYSHINKNQQTQMINHKSGMYCCKCNTFNEYVNIPNQSDGTYKCYSCRS